MAHLYMRQSGQSRRVLVVVELYRDAMQEVVVSVDMPHVVGDTATRQRVKFVMDIAREDGEVTTRKGRSLDEGDEAQTKERGTHAGRPQQTRSTASTPPAGSPDRDDDPCGEADNPSSRRFPLRLTAHCYDHAMAPTGSLLTRVIPRPDQLPKVDFQVIPSKAPRGVPDKQNESVSRPATQSRLFPNSPQYGFNDGKDWELPDGYIRWLRAHRHALSAHRSSPHTAEPIEADLAKQVEYDMDDIDKEWLDVVNAERRKDGHEPVSYEFFEILMDRLEKEWFELVRCAPTHWALSHTGRTVRSHPQTRLSHGH
jgi:hypothetical protein